MRDTRLDVAIRIAHDAARSLGEHRVEAQRVRSAIGRDIKLEGDFFLDRFILDRLRGDAPLPIVSEESGGVLTDGDCWVVDPLDGSFNFARDLPFCAISIGLWRDRQPLLGVVHDIPRGETFTGQVGEGAWLDGAPIAPSAVADRSQAAQCTGVPIRNTFDSEAAARFVERLRTFKKTRLLGSAALMLAYVACGRADCYREDAIAVWDIAAGAAIVKAAGGRIAWRTGPAPGTLDVEAANGVLPMSGEEGLVLQ